MDFLEYREVVQSCISLEKDIEGITNTIARVKDELTSLEAEYDTRMKNIIPDKENIVAQEIQQTVFDQTQSQRKTYKEKTQQFNNLQSQQYKEDLNSATEYFSDYLILCDGVNTLSQRLELNYSGILQRLTSNDEYNFNSLTMNQKYDTLLDSLNYFENIADVTSDISINAKFNKIFETVLTLGKGISTGYRLAYYIVLSIVLTFALVVLPAFICLLLGYKMYKFSTITLNQREALVKTLKQIGYYKALSKSLSKDITARIKSRLDKERTTFEKQKAEQIDQLSKEIQSLNTTISAISSNVEVRIKENSKKDNYVQTQRMKISSDYEPRIEAKKNEISMLTEQFETFKTNYKDLTEKRDMSKQELEERYFKLTSPGTSKILPESFLLGFNDYEPIMVDMQNYSVNIIPTMSGADKSVETFINMCVIQILCACNPSCVNLKIVDLEQGTGRYGIFGSLQSKGIVTIVKTKDELQETIRSLYTLKSERDCSIVRTSDHINGYNQQMIDNYGLTLPYQILLVTHYIPDLLTNVEFNQLLVAGNVGIATICVWNSIFTCDTKDNYEATNSGKLNLLNLISKTAETMDDITSLYSISTGGLLVPIKKRELEDKRKNMVMQIAKLKSTRRI